MNIICAVETQGFYTSVIHTVFNGLLKSYTSWTLMNIEKASRGRDIVSLNEHNSLIQPARHQSIAMGLIDKALLATFPLMGIVFHPARVSNGESVCC